MKLTVFCAVWHLDKYRMTLLKAHMKNLDALKTEVNRVYVFDGNDSPPKWLKGEIIVVKNKLTIYEAWNVALSRVSTPYVMNLNLDDRLHPDAACKFIKSLEDGSDFVGGEWEICFSQSETDSDQFEENLCYLGDWPPLKNQKTILGSGSGQRGTYGPACAWKMNLHLQFPRYPYRFSDGVLVKVIGDLLWWQLLKYNNKKLVRLSEVVGKYYSHPGEQAEFRYDDDEIEKFKLVGASLI